MYDDNKHFSYIRKYISHYTRRCIREMFVVIIREDV